MKKTHKRTAAELNFIFALFYQTSTYNAQKDRGLFNINDGKFLLIIIYNIAKPLKIWELSLLNHIYLKKLI